jgi:hypothetical protein
MAYILFTTGSGLAPREIGRGTVPVIDREATMNQPPRIPLDKRKLALSLAGMLLSAGFFFMAWTFYFHPGRKSPFDVVGVIDRFLGPDGVAGACVAFGVLFALGSLLVCMTARGNRE